jgi:hypothetical protein
MGEIGRNEGGIRRNGMKRVVRESKGRKDR